MRHGTWKRLLAATATTLAWVGLGNAYGQQANQVTPLPPSGLQQTLPTSYYEPEQPVQPDELTKLRERLDRYESELGELRQAQSTAAAAEEKAKADEQAKADKTTEADKEEKAKEEDSSEPKKVELITKPEFSVFGRLFFDQLMYDEDGLPTASGSDPTLENETGFDSVRIGAKGYVYENIYGQVEFEFEGSEVDYKDNYFEVQELGYSGYAVRGGFFKEPFSLEELMSARTFTFMERSVAHGAFVPSRNFGVMAQDHWGDNEDVSWAVGAFRDSSVDSPTGRGTITEDNGDVSGTGRLAWNPYYDEPSEGRYLVHLGTSYSYRNTTGETSGVTGENLRFDTNQELGSQSGYLAVDVGDDDDFHLFGGEAAFNAGPFGMQGEYYLAATGEANFWGGYVQASYFLTGEHRGYKRESKTFDRITLHEDFFCVRTGEGVCKGTGAWEIAARCSYVDLDDEGTGGPNRGEQGDLTLGLNWYWNQYTRMQFNYIYNDVDRAEAPDGNPQFFGTRFHIDY